VIDRLARRQPIQELAHFFVYGLVGLMIEWFAIGLSPWSDSDANALLMLVFQLGMFSFWASVSFLPRLFSNVGELSVQARKSILKFYIPYFIITYIIAFLVPGSLKFVTIIPLVLFGYLFLNVFYWRYFLRSFSGG
jgi:hypothetical protein